VTDPELIAKKLARIETCVQELGIPERLGKDPREENRACHLTSVAEARPPLFRG
jgi:hypothetical protein